MPLSPGAYPVTVTATRPDGVTVTHVSTLTIQGAVTDQNISVGAANESDSAGSVGVGLDQSVSVGSAQETDTAPSVTPTNNITIATLDGVVVSAVALSVNVNPATETDSAGSVGASVDGDTTVNVGAADETDTAGLVSPAMDQSVGVGSATESGQAGSVTPEILGDVSVNVGASTETNSAGSVSARPYLEDFNVVTPTNRTFFVTPNGRTGPTFVKDSSDNIDYLLVYGATLQGDPISGVSISVQNIILEDQLFTADEVQVWVSGGSANALGVVEVEISTEGGRIIERTFKVKVGEY